LSARIQGRIFGPGLDGAGEVASARWVGKRFVVDLAGQSLETLDVAVKATGFNAAMLEVSWSAQDGRFAFLIDDPAARAVYTACAPPAVTGGAQEGARAAVRVERRFRLGWALLAALALMPLLFIGWLAVNADTAAGWVVDQIPVAQEAQLGELVLAQTKLQMTLSDSGLAVDAVRQIGEQLTGDTVHQYRWFVADGPALNAFAAPGGVVVVFSGLIRAVDTPEELAGVLAHEVAHAELRHGLRAMVKKLGLQALITVVLGDMSGGMLGEAAAGLTELKFSRDAEREADRNGMQRLLAAGIDPAGMVRFFEKLDQQDKLTPPAFLSTHPDSGERATRLGAEIAALGEIKTRPLAIDWPAVKASMPVENMK
jgi:Zn-dependent protease with chaperone function